MTEKCRFALTLRVAEIERFTRHREGITVERSADRRPDQGGDRIMVTHEDGTAAVVWSEKEKCTSVGSTTSSGIKRHRMAHYIRQHETLMEESLSRDDKNAENSQVGERASGL